MIPNDTNARGGYWAVILDGEFADLDDWRWTLQPPFDPWIETDDTQRPVFRSTEFAQLTTGDEVRERALFILDALGGAVKVKTGAGRVQFAGLNEVRPDGTKDHYLFPDLFVERPRFGRPELLGGQSVAPKPSPVQHWYGISTTNRVLADTLRHHGQEANWYNLYKTFEGVRRLSGGKAALNGKPWAPPASEISRFRHTANYYHRHAFNPQEQPPPNPMGSSDAASMIDNLVRGVLQELFP